MTAAFVVGERVSEMFRRGLHVTEIDVDIPLLDYGLDSVRSAELVIELERTFGVEITDVEAAELHTARDVIDCVTTKMGHTGVGA
ncbi:MULTISPECIES: acyl carrier protein [unclassified Nocardia]|uniref:acyl carrier protein n=1 Tax=unclassified Nocardia TaxID=2637762 RepID=UPI001CE3F464|nr:MULTISPECIES: acyl carrier protein [unclassified Nocardia]